MESQLSRTLADLEEETTLSLVRQELEAGADPVAVLEACRQGMELVGQRYEQNEYFLSDLIMAGEIFNQVGDLLAPHLAMTNGGESKGVVVVGTVQGDIHDIGKNVVVTLLRSAQYDVHDLGVDVPTDRFVETVRNTGARVVGLSGLLTTSFDPMKETVAALAAAGLRDQVKVMIGGGPVTEKVVGYTGANAMGSDAMDAVHLCNEWTEVS